MSQTRVVEQERSTVAIAGALVTNNAGAKTKHESTCAFKFIYNGTKALVLLSLYTMPWLDLGYI